MTPSANHSQADPSSITANETTGLTSDTLSLSPVSDNASEINCTAVRMRSPDAQNRAWEEQAKAYIADSRSENTRKAYASDWKDFIRWCFEYGHVPLPASPETVVLYLVCLAENHKVSTLQRRLTTISQVHQAADNDSPTQTALVKTTWKGIRRQLGVSPDRKCAAMTEHIRAMLASLPDTVSGARTRALILVGYAGALRRSEIVALDKRDIVFGPHGVTITIRKSKTDQEGQGDRLGIPFGAEKDTCPVRALSAWLKVSGIAKGPVFRGVDRHGNVSPKRLTGRSVALLVKSAAAAAGLDSTAFSGHSLRAGIITEAATAGIEERDIARQSRHKSTAVLRSYIREVDIWRSNVAGRVGL